MRSSVVTSLICSSAQLYGALDWDLSSVFCRQPTLLLSLLTGWQIPLGHCISRLVERQKRKIHEDLTSCQDRSVSFTALSDVTGSVQDSHKFWAEPYFFYFSVPAGSQLFRFWTNLFLCQNVPKCSKLGEQTTTDLAPCLWQRNPQIYTNTTCSQSVEKKRTEQQSGTAKKLL